MGLNLECYRLSRQRRLGARGGEGPHFQLGPMSSVPREVNGNDCAQSPRPLVETWKLLGWVTGFPGCQCSGLGALWTQPEVLGWDCARVCFGCFKKSTRGHINAKIFWQVGQMTFCVSLACKGSWPWLVRGARSGRVTEDGVIDSCPSLHPPTPARR